MPLTTCYLYSLVQREKQPWPFDKNAALCNVILYWYCSPGTLPWVWVFVHPSEIKPVITLWCGPYVGSALYHTCTCYLARTNDVDTVKSPDSSRLWTWPSNVYTPPPAGLEMTERSGTHKTSVRERFYSPHLSVLWPPGLCPEQR